LAQVITAAAKIPYLGGVLVLRSEHVGDIELAVASSPDLVTSVGIVIRVDGGIDVTQVLTPLSLDRTTAVLHARRSLLGQWLYQSNELTSYGMDTAPEELRDILTGAAADPVLSAMAFHAWSGILARNGSDRPPDGPDARRLREQVGNQLTNRFPRTVEAMVIAALLDDSYRSRLRGLASLGLVPVLADSARIAAAMLDDSQSPLTAMARRVPPDSLWTLRWSQPEGRVV
jgi:hypothetical protein